MQKLGTSAGRSLGLPGKPSPAETVSSRSGERTRLKKKVGKGNINGHINVEEGNFYSVPRLEKRTPGRY